MIKENTCDCSVIYTKTVDKVNRKMPSESMLDGITELYKIMGDSTRIKILFALDVSEMCVNDIANVLNMSKSSISHQLALLRKNGIIKNRKVGKEVFYSLDDEHIQKLFEISVEHVEHKQSEK